LCLILNYGISTDNGNVGEYKVNYLVREHQHTPDEKNPARAPLSSRPTTTIGDLLCKLQKQGKENNKGTQNA
jgi:hypothetical protein